MHVPGCIPGGFCSGLWFVTSSSWLIFSWPPFCFLPDCFCHYLDAETCGDILVILVLPCWISSLINVHLLSVPSGNAELSATCQSATDNLPACLPCSIHYLPETHGSSHLDTSITCEREKYDSSWCWLWGKVHFGISLQYISRCMCMCAPFHFLNNFLWFRGCKKCFFKQLLYQHWIIMTFLNVLFSWNSCAWTLHLSLHWNLSLVTAIVYAEVGLSSFFLR